VKAVSVALLAGEPVDLVHGHSAHHVRAIEVHRGKPILYGCGDLINDYEGIPKPPERAAFRPELGLLFLARFALPERRFLGLELWPTRLRWMRVERALCEDVRELAKLLERASEAVGTRVSERDGLLRLDYAAPG
jgi:poly-gamma-glutamate synthesis protein (capsule biosynthesis protein)